MNKNIFIACVLAGSFFSSPIVGQGLPMPGLTHTAEKYQRIKKPHKTLVSTPLNFSSTNNEQSAGAVLVRHHWFVKADQLPSPKNTPQGPKFLSLKDSILLALRNNPDVESSELQRVVDKFALEVSHYEFEPHFTIVGSTLWASGQHPSHNVGPQMDLKTPIGTDVSVGYDNPFKGGSPGSVQATITQPLLKGAGWAVGTSGLADAVDAEQVARLNFKNSVITAVVNVVNAYRNLVQGYDSLEQEKRSLLRAKQTVQQYKLEVKAGKMAPNDLLQQQSSYATNELSFLQQKSSMKELLILILEILENKKRNRKSY